MNTIVRRGRYLLAALLLPLLLASLAAPAGPAMAEPVAPWSPRDLTASLKGTGATFPNPLYQVWVQVYKQIVPGVTINYQGVGSGQGIRDFIGYLTDFGGTDAAISADQVSTQAPDTLHVPTVMGGVVATYNVPGVTNLRFSPVTLVGIFIGSITRWNDAAIAAGNPGVASTVKLTKGAIGYVELIFALANGLPAPAVKNASGNYVLPTLASVTLAAEGIVYPENVAVSLTNPPGANAYPISGFTYILVRANTYTDMNKAQALTDFIYWGLTEGQGASSRLGYAALPTAARLLAIRQLYKVTVNGQQVFSGPLK